MSHFTVTVRVTAERLARHAGDYRQAVKEILAPYQENNMGNCPQQFLVFYDADEPVLKKGETREQVMAANGYKQHPDDPKRWGYWENPNKKWDGWVIGGHRRGYYPVKAGVTPTDVMTIDQIDMDVVATKEREAFETFKAERAKLLASEKSGSFGGPRSPMRSLGLLREERDPNAALQPDEVQIGKTWGEDNPNITDERSSWRDVVKVLSDAQLETYRCAFNPLRTYAAVDDLGWYQPGQMGWFGYASHTPDSYLAYAEAFQESFIRKAGPQDLLIVVDCHI